MQQIRKCAAERNLDSRIQASDSKFAPRIESIDIGDFVLLHAEHNIANHRATGKLDSNWIGPFIVVQLVPPSSFILQNCQTGKRTNPIHTRHVIKIKPPVIPEEESKAAVETEKFDDSNADVDDGERALELSSDSKNGDVSPDSKRTASEARSRPTRQRRPRTNFAPLISN